MNTVTSERREQLREIAGRMGGKFGEAIVELCDGLDDMEDLADGRKLEIEALEATVDQLRKPENNLDSFFADSPEQAAKP